MMADNIETCTPESCLSAVERVALERSGFALRYAPEEQIGSIVVDNFPALGRLTALRFLEWALENPEGVISLPTGKTPEHFIKFVRHYLAHWDKPEVGRSLEELGLGVERKPDLSGLRFVQIDEFYPIESSQHNSFHYYVNKYYLKGFGLDPARALLIDPSEIGLADNQDLSDVFPEMTLDLQLRFKRGKSLQEKRQQEVLARVDQFCTDYERRIRDMGGIGFFLGGIGPDGHIAFNVRGSDRFSTTRLTEINYETQAGAASDLGGIEVSRHKHVITIGLATITHNPDTVALVIAAGEAKAHMVARTIESPPANRYPGSVLGLLPRARFYLTRGAAQHLERHQFAEFERREQATEEEAHRIVTTLSLKMEKALERLTADDFAGDRFAAELLKKTGEAPDALAARTRARLLESLERGHNLETGRTYLHTAPHHDDIILAYLPYFSNLALHSDTRHYFAYMTSGFNAVTNKYMEHAVADLRERLESGRLDDLLEAGHFDPAKPENKRLDMVRFLEGEARSREEEKQCATACRLLHNMMELYEEEDVDNILHRLSELQNYFRTQYPGKKDIRMVQNLKSRMREWESDLKWALFGFTGETVRHLRLGFYKGEIFTEAPTADRDVPPILNLLKEANPDVVTVAFDPEGSGPDTHYKVLQAMAAALRLHEKQSGRSDLRVIGYRNVWHRFPAAEANLYVPVSIRHLNNMDAVFNACFMTQRDASFPSPEYDGPFSKLARKIQVKQLQQIKTMLGEDFFIYHEDHVLRSCLGLVYLREMSLEEFYTKSDELKNYAEML